MKKMRLSHKICHRCKRDLPRDAFEKKEHGRSINGIYDRCRECREYLRSRLWGGTVHEKFWLYVKKTDTCWLWTGDTDDDGYGHLANRHKHYRAHRLSYEIHHGPIPPGMSVCHTCDVRTCVNPDHLWLGSNTENTADRHGKGRDKGPHLGERHHGAKLTVDAVLEIRARRERGETLRAIADRFGVNNVTVLNVVRRRTWSHVA